VTGAPVPGTRPSALVAAPECDGPGCWAGAPSALVVDGVVWVAYRLRRPDGRGGANVLARSDDGGRFEPVARFPKERFGAESLERPALARTPDGRWRLYLSCATPGTKHWRIDVLEAAEPEGLEAAPAHTALPGDPAAWGVKDPVIRARADGGWRAWICCHPLDEPGEEDRMVSRAATSDDGISWTWTGEELTGRPGAWDARGVRVTADLGDVLLYDGRATKEENFHERTGVALRENGGAWRLGDAPVADVRYADVTQTGGTLYEAARPDGAHELRSEGLSLAPPAA
jgi:hypothetical protein